MLMFRAFGAFGDQHAGSCFRGFRRPACNRGRNAHYPCFSATNTNWRSTREPGRSESQTRHAMKRCRCQSAAVTGDDWRGGNTGLTPVEPRTAAVAQQRMQQRLCSSCWLQRMSGAADSGGGAAANAAALVQQLLAATQAWSRWSRGQRRRALRHIAPWHMALWHMACRHMALWHMALWHVAHGTNLALWHMALRHMAHGVWHTELWHWHSGTWRSGTWHSGTWHLALWHTAP